MRKNVKLMLMVILVMLIVLPISAYGCTDPTPVIQVDQDEVAAYDFSAKVADIPMDIKYPDHEEVIAKAIAAYESLTEKGKAFEVAITAKVILDDAIATLADKKRIYDEWAATMKKINDFVNAVALLPDEVEGLVPEDYSKIQEAKEFYALLSVSQKSDANVVAANKKLVTMDGAIDQVIYQATVLEAKPFIDAVGLLPSLSAMSYLYKTEVDTANTLYSGLSANAKLNQEVITAKAKLDAINEIMPQLEQENTLATQKANEFISMVNQLVSLDVETEFEQVVSKLQPAIDAYAQLNQLALSKNGVASAKTKLDQVSSAVSALIDQDMEGVLDNLVAAVDALPTVAATNYIAAHKALIDVAQAEYDKLTAVQKLSTVAREKKNILDACLKEYNLIKAEVDSFESYINTFSLVLISYNSEPALIIGKDKFDNLSEKAKVSDVGIIAKARLDELWAQYTDIALNTTKVSIIEVSTLTVSEMTGLDYTGNMQIADISNGQAQTITNLKSQIDAYATNLGIGSANDDYVKNNIVFALYIFDSNTGEELFVIKNPIKINEFIPSFIDIYLLFEPYFVENPTREFDVHYIARLEVASTATAAFKNTFKNSSPSAATNTIKIKKINEKRLLIENAIAIETNFNLTLNNTANSAWFKQSFFDNYTIRVYYKFAPNVYLTSFTVKWSNNAARAFYGEKSLSLSISTSNIITITKSQVQGMLKELLPSSTPNNDAYNDLNQYVFTCEAVAQQGQGWMNSPTSLKTSEWYFTYDNNLETYMNFITLIENIGTPVYSESFHSKILEAESLIAGKSARIIQESKAKLETIKAEYNDLKQAVMSEFASLVTSIPAIVKLEHYNAILQADLIYRTMFGEALEDRDVIALASTLEKRRDAYIKLDSEYEQKVLIVLFEEAIANVGTFSYRAPSVYARIEAMQNAYNALSEQTKGKAEVKALKTQYDSIMSKYNSSPNHKLPSNNTNQIFSPNNLDTGSRAFEINRGASLFEGGRVLGNTKVDYVIVYVYNSSNTAVGSHLGVFYIAWNGTQIDTYYYNANNAKVIVAQENKSINNSYLSKAQARTLLQGVLGSKYSNSTLYSFRSKVIANPYMDYFDGDISSVTQHNWRYD